MAPASGVFVDMCAYFSSMKSQEAYLIAPSRVILPLMYTDTQAVPSCLFGLLTTTVKLYVCSARIVFGGTFRIAPVEINV